MGAFLSRIVEFSLASLVSVNPSAAEKIKRFNHYKGLRIFKEKYATLWENKYLVSDNDFDLLQLPSALNTVIKT